MRACGPQRIRALVNLEGFGMPASRPAQAPKRYARWMDELKAFHRGEMALKTYDSDGGRGGPADEDQQAPDARTRPTGWPATGPSPMREGRWRILGDPAHKVINPQLYRVDEVLEIYKSITAPTLVVRGQRGQPEPVVARQIHPGRVPRAPEGGARPAHAP